MDKDWIVCKLSMERVAKLNKLMWQLKSICRTGALPLSLSTYCATITSISHRKK